MRKFISLSLSVCLVAFVGTTCNTQDTVEVSQKTKDQLIELAQEIDSLRVIARSTATRANILEGQALSMLNGILIDKGYEPNDYRWAGDKFVKLTEKEKDQIKKAQEQAARKEDE